MAVFRAGPQPPAPDGSVSRRTSIASSGQPPDLNRELRLAVDLNSESEDMPDRTPERMSEDMPESVPEDKPEIMSERMSDERMSEDMPESQKICQKNARKNIRRYARKNAEIMFQYSYTPENLSA